MDLLIGKNKCNNFRSNWIKTVPRILEVAAQSKNKGVKIILKQYGSREEFGNVLIIFFSHGISSITMIRLIILENQSCCALELLPLILPGPVKKARDSLKYFFDVHEVRY